MAQDQQRLLTPEFRVAFANIWTPTKNDKGDEKYNMVCIFPAGTDLTIFKQAAEKAARDFWGANLPHNLRSPFKKGETKLNKDGERYEGFDDGTVFISPSSKYRPGLVDANLQEIIDESEFYSGCFARATLNAYAYKHPQSGPGVSFGLNNIQKTRDGKPFAGSRTDPSDDFDVLPTGNPATSSAAPAADENDSLFD